jgi:hypothetical protein
MFVNLLFRFIYLCLAISQTYLGLFIITIHLITSLYLIIKLNVIQEYFNTYIKLYNYLKDLILNYYLIIIIVLIIQIFIFIFNLKIFIIYELILLPILILSIYLY